MKKLTPSKIEVEKKVIVQSLEALIRAVKNVERGIEPNKKRLMPFVCNLKEAYDNLEGQDEETRGKVLEILKKYNGLDLLKDDITISSK